MFQMDISITGVSTMLFLMFLMGLMIVCYLKMRTLVVMTGVFLLSLILGFIALMIDMPLAPYIQIFFILFQTLIYIVYAFDLNRPRYKEVN